MAIEEIQYSNSVRWSRDPGDPNVVGEIDKLRVASYNLYDGIYHNRQESLKVQIRGDDSNPIYMPSGKKIIEATSRYLMVGFDYFARTPSDDTGNEEPVTVDSEESANTIEGYFANFFKREKVKAKLINQKRYCLIRGDAIWYIVADPNKEQGRRLSLLELDPRQYFPIMDEADTNKVIGCHIVDLVQDPRKPDDKAAKVARRQTYRKDVNEAGQLRAITSERTCWEIGTWDDRILKPEDMKKVSNPGQDIPLFDLPPQITSLPIYHYKNNMVPNSDFGMSELSGMESLIFAINQAITDEDLTLVMQGLGMYTTNAAPPQNNDGTPGDWNVGPGQVIEVGTDQEFSRVTGVSSVAPYIEHVKAIDDAMAQGSGTPEIAIGAVDVAVAESGIALMLQMGPILAKNAEKELEWILTTDQMFYDIVNMWLPAYEQIQPNGSAVQTIVDDPMPVNRDAKIQELILLYTSGVVTLSMVIQDLMTLGYQFPSNDPEEAAMMINAEQKQKSIDMMGDPYSGGEGGIGDEEDTGESEGMIDAGMT